LAVLIRTQRKQRRSVVQPVLEQQSEQFGLVMQFREGLAARHRPVIPPAVKPGRSQLVDELQHAARTAREVSVLPTDEDALGAKPLRGIMQRRLTGNGSARSDEPSSEARFPDNRAGRPGLTSLQLRGEQSP